MSNATPLIVIAHQLEAKSFQASGLPVFITGIGKTEGTLQLTKKLLTGAPVSEILVYGTAGRLTKSVDFNRVYEVASALEYDALNTPEIAWRGVGERIATGSDFLHDARLASNLGNLGATLVDMETYAYARVAQQFNIPIRVFKIVSDEANDEAEKLWDDHVLELSEKLLSHYLENFVS